MTPDFEPRFEPRDPDFERRVRASFARQGIMQTIGATLLRVAPGEVEVALPFRDDLTQQHGYLHAGVVTTIVDSACGYAALSLMPPGAGVLTATFNISLLAPASGERMLARGHVVKPGRTLIFTAGEVYAEQAGQQKLVATMTATVMAVHNRPGVSD